MADNFSHQTNTGNTVNVVGDHTVVQFIESNRAKRRIESATVRLFTSLKKRYENRYAQKLDGRSSAIPLKGCKSFNYPNYQGSNQNDTNNVKVGEAVALIKDAFDKEGRLLIVGSQGVGKSVLLLRLAIDLMKEVRDPENEPFPVIFNLVSWSNNYINFKDWLITMLVSDNNLSEELADALLYQGRVILLLDGLDELGRNEPEEIAQLKRAECLASLNSYLRRGRKVVICCRRDVFIQMSDKTGQDAVTPVMIEVSTLDESEVKSELFKAQQNLESRDAAIHLLTLVEANKAFLEVLRTPFFFIAALDVFDKEASDNFPNDQKLIENYLIKRFVEIKLSNPPPPTPRKLVGHPVRFRVTFRNSLARKEFPDEKAKRWLKWLASLVNRKNLVAFELLNLQPTDLLNVKKFRLAGSFLSGIIIGSIYGLLIGLGLGAQEYSKQNNFFESLIIGLFSFGVSSLIIGLIIGLFNRFGTGIGASMYEDNQIEANEIVVINLSNLLTRRTWITSIGWSCLGGGAGIYFGLRDHHLGVKNGILLGLIIGLFACLFDKVRSISYFVFIKTPYQRLISIFLLKWLGWLIAALFFFLLLSYFQSQFNEVFGFLIVMSPVIIVETLFFTPLVKHAVLRLCLHLEGLIPLRYVTFLNYAAAVGILERDGGQWRFRHQILQQYFANLEGY